MTSSHASRFVKGLPFFGAMLAAVSLVGCGSGGAGSMNPAMVQGSGQGSGTQLALKQLSTDTLTNPGSQHATEAGPGLAVSGSTLVTAFQVGLNVDSGAADIGFATSTDNGTTWINRLLMGITTIEGGTFAAASDPTVAFDQSHGIWMIAALGVGNNSNTVIVTRSTDAMTWLNPIAVSTTPDADKPWITCDNNASSQFFGHCYIEWDDPSNNGLVWMSTSIDGGLNWQPALNTADMVTGFGGQPVVAANGLVVVPIQNAGATKMLAFTSLDGGVSWTVSVTISTITDHLVAGNLRTAPLPSAAVDSSGRVYVVWQDCRFRTNCVSNDIILSTSTGGLVWTAPVAIPIDQINAHTVDHFLPALAVEPGSSGGAALLGLTYYFFPDAACTASSCQLDVGFIGSSDGGNTWDTATTLAGPISLASLANTNSGVTVGDYVATAYANGQPHAVFAVAQPKAGSVFAEAINTTLNPLAQVDEARRKTIPADHAVTQQSDHPPRK